MEAPPPGPRGEPLFGSSRRYARDPLGFVEACEAAYDGVVRFDLGPIETYLLVDPVDIERVLVSDATLFRKPDFQGDALGDLLGNGLLLSEGQTWRDQRRLASPAFTTGRLLGFVDDIVGHTDRMLADWDDGASVDVEREMTEVTLSVISDLMLGVDLEDERIETIREALVPLGTRFEPNPVRFAAPRWLPMPGDSEYRNALETVERVVDDIVSERRGTHGGPGAEGPNDLVSILLRAQDRNEQSDRQIRDEVVTMLLAGHDTTALTLTYAWYLLSRHPDAERRVHDEVSQVLGDEPPAAGDLPDLTFVEQVIDESMRLYPPVYVMFREPKLAVKLGGYRVPEGSAIMLSQWAMHRSERFWDEPKSFDPDRWTRSADRPRFAYFPFGGGPRHCIGKHLAKLEAKLILALTAQRYRLEYTRDDEPELWPTLTMHPRDGMPMRLHAR